MSKIFDLAKKLKALADRGVGGEKFNAANKLRELCKKHGIELSDLDEAETCRRYVIFKKNHVMITSHVIRSVLGFSCDLYTAKSYRNRVYFYSTNAEFIEITALLDLYLKAYRKELGYFNHAFIIKNGLAAPADSKKGPDVDLKEAKKILAMAEGIDTQGRFKALLK